MISSKKLFDLIINNDYEELSFFIQNKQIDYMLINRKRQSLLSIAIEYRSIECFDLLIDNIPQTIFEKMKYDESGILKALDYYNSAPNIKNKYYVEKIFNKNINISDETVLNKLVKNIKVFNQFSDYVLNEKATNHLMHILDSEIFEIIFKYCLENNLLNDIVIKNVLTQSFYNKKDDILVLIKDTQFINDIWTLCPNIIQKLIHHNMSNSLVLYYINLFETIKPLDISYENILKDIILKEIEFPNGYYGYVITKKYNEYYKNILLLFNNNKKYDFNDLINDIINDLITKPFQKTYISLEKTYLLRDVGKMSYFLSIIILYIKNSINFKLNIELNVDLVNLLKDYKNKNHEKLVSGLKTLINELLKLNIMIPENLNFIKENDEIKSIELINNETKRLKKKKDLII